jgi:hypothetical protein
MKIRMGFPILILKNKIRKKQKSFVFCFYRGIKYGRKIKGGSHLLNAWAAGGSKSFPHNGHAKPIPENEGSDSGHGERGINPCY